MGIETDDGKDPIEALLESGKLTENASVAEIEALLNGEEPAESTASDKSNADADAASAAGGDGAGESKSGTTEDTAGETRAAEQAAATDVKQSAEQSSARDQQTDDVQGPVAGKNGGTIPYGVLSGTRRSLEEARRKLQEVEDDRAQERQKREQAERERDELRAKVGQQQSATTEANEDVQAAAAAAGIKGDVRTIDVSKLRDNFPAEIVDAIEAMQANNAALARQVAELRQRDVSRTKTDEEIRAEKRQETIDSVPALANWQANDPVMWKAAQAVDDALCDDATWKDKSPVERFQEVVRRLGGDPAPRQENKPNGSPSAANPTAAGTKAKVDEALAAAAARAIPLSHSGLPAGSAPAQSEAESLDRLDVTQVADKFATMSEEQLSALLARV